MPRKTPAGAEAAAKWRAFRNYLDSIERYEKLDEAQGIFDRYLPYAIAFGLESSWVDKFSRVPTASPTLVWRRCHDLSRAVRRERVPADRGTGRTGGTVIIPGGGGYGPYAGTGGRGGARGQRRTSGGRRPVVEHA